MEGRTSEQEKQRLNILTSYVEAYSKIRNQGDLIPSNPSFNSLLQVCEELGIDKQPESVQPVAKLTASLNMFNELLIVTNTLKAQAKERFPDKTEKETDSFTFIPESRVFAETQAIYKAIEGYRGVNATRLTPDIVAQKSADMYPRINLSYNPRQDAIAIEYSKEEKQDDGKTK